MGKGNGRPVPNLLTFLSSSLHDKIRKCTKCFALVLQTSPNSGISFVKHTGAALNPETVHHYDIAMLTGPVMLIKVQFVTFKNVNSK
jgi:hypothetical protein